MQCSQSQTNENSKPTFHLVMLSLAMTGLFMAFSAEELGSAGPVIISIGISTIFFALIAETLNGLLFALKHMAKRTASAEKTKEIE